MRVPFSRLSSLRSRRPLSSRYRGAYAKRGCKRAKWAERVPQRRFAVSALPKSLLTLRRYDSVRWSGNFWRLRVLFRRDEHEEIVVARRFRVVVVTLDDDVGEAGSVQHQEQLAPEVHPDVQHALFL